MGAYVRFVGHSPALDLNAAVPQGLEAYGCLRSRGPSAGRGRWTLGQVWTQGLWALSVALGPFGEAAWLSRLMGCRVLTFQGSLGAQVWNFLGLTWGFVFFAC